MHTLVLRPSRQFGRLRWLCAGLTGALALWLLLAGQVAAAAAAGSAALLAWRVRQPGWRLRLAADGHCGLEAPDAAPVAATLRVASAFGAAGWLVLGLAGGAHGRGKVLVLAPDAVQAEELRQLRVWLRLVAPRAVLNSRAATVS